jgi:hypothetical protein
MPDPGRVPEPIVRHDVATDPLSTLKLVLSWLVVGIPGAWGVYHVVVSALELFRR